MNLGLGVCIICWRHHNTDLVQCANEMPYTDKGFRTSRAFEHLQEFIMFLSKRTEKKASSVGRVCMASTHTSLSGLSSPWWTGCEDRWSQGRAIMNLGDGVILMAQQSRDYWPRMITFFCILSVCLFTCSMFNHVCRQNVSCYQQGALETQKQHTMLLEPNRSCVFWKQNWYGVCLHSALPFCSYHSVFVTTSYA